MITRHDKWAKSAMEGEDVGMRVFVLSPVKMGSTTDHLARSRKSSFIWPSELFRQQDGTGESVCTE